MSASLAWRAEEACLNAWPGLRYVVHGDWIARFGEGLSRRANSVSPLREDAQGLVERLDAFAALYRTHGLPLIVRVPTLLDPAIDRHLAQAGFSAEGETCTPYGAMDAVTAQHDAAVSFSDEPDAPWLDAFNTFHGRDPRERVIFQRIVRGIALRTAFVTLREQGVIASVAMGALHDGLLCIESVITSAQYRGQGHGRRMLGALSAWARDHGATGVCLQVEASNAPGLALYHRLGLRTELSRYHYRRAPNR